MRLGGVDEWFGGWGNIDETVAKKIVDLGFTGMGLHYHGDPMEQSLDDALQTKAILDDHGIEIVQFWGSYPCLISTDESVRREAVRIVQNIVRRASEVGSLNASIRPTSLHPTRQWAPHPDNFLPETEDRMVKSLTEIGATADDYGIPVTLECAETTVLTNPAKIKRIIERTGSPWIKVNADVTNFAKDIPTIYNSTAMIDEVFDVLGPYIVTAHLKDVDLEPTHQVRFTEVVPGKGILDWDTLLRRFEALLPDGYALIEHLNDYDKVVQARNFVVGKLDELNITIRK